MFLLPSFIAINQSYDEEPHGGVSSPSHIDVWPENTSPAKPSLWLALLSFLFLFFLQFVEVGIRPTQGAALHHFSHLLHMMDGCAHSPAPCRRHVALYKTLTLRGFGSSYIYNPSNSCNISVLYRVLNGTTDQLQTLLIVTTHHPDGDNLLHFKGLL